MRNWTDVFIAAVLLTVTVAVVTGPFVLPWLLMK